MCRIALPRDDAPPGAPSTSPTRLVLLAAGIGAAAGIGQVWALVAWPPVVALVAGAAFVGFTAPRHAWSLGFLMGVVVGTVSGAAASRGWHVPALYGVLGPFGATLPALAGTHLGQMAAAFATRLRGTRTVTT